MENIGLDGYQSVGKQIMQKWDKALSWNGGISDEHLALTTAILMENYLTHLNKNPRLIAEDKVQSSAFTGVNLALLGLIRRTIPELIGAELVGLQAMPSPTSPIFTMKWVRDHAKGATSAGDEMFVTPIPSGTPFNIDPYYTSETVREEDSAVPTGATNANPVVLTWANENIESLGKPYLIGASMYLQLLDADGVVLGELIFNGNYDNSGTPVTATVSSASPNAADAGLTALASGGASELEYNNPASFATVRQIEGSGAGAWTTTINGTAIATARVHYEYRGESEPNIPEISFSISETSIRPKRRQLRGRFSADAAFDVKNLHGINLESELNNMMKIELMGEINKEIIADLRSLAANTYQLDFQAFVTGTTTGQTTAGNYDDAQKLLLDAVNQVAGEIWNVGRMGQGNWVVGNPVTLAFLDRVPGFAGSGVTYSGKSISFAGSSSGGMKFYKDPTYPKNELLIGYKGPSALDAGYIHAPYLPITASPTVYDKFTADPSKIFYTRYGKTWTHRGGGADGSQPVQHILNGNYQYARLSLTNTPSYFV